MLDAPKQFIQTQRLLSMQDTLVLGHERRRPRSLVSIHHVMHCNLRSDRYYSASAPYSNNNNAYWIMIHAVLFLIKEAGYIEILSENVLYHLLQSHVDNQYWDCTKSQLVGKASDQRLAEWNSPRFSAGGFQSMKRWLEAQMEGHDLFVRKHLLKGTAHEPIVQNRPCLGHTMDARAYLMR